LRVIASKVFKIGLQKLLYDERKDLYYIQIRNKTYFSMHLVSKEKVEEWKKELSLK